MATQQGAKSMALNRRKLGERLREAREYVGLSQVDVAKHIGIPRSALSHIESGQRGIDALELKSLAAIYKLPVGFFTNETPTKAQLPDDVAHIARKLATLSKTDQEELIRFADYLKARKTGK